MERSMEDFWRLMAQWGIPLPNVRNSGMRPAAAPQPRPSAYAMPALEENPPFMAPEAQEEVRSRFRPAEFTPPAQIAEDNQGVFGDFMSRLGLRGTPGPSLGRGGLPGGGASSPSFRQQGPAPMAAPPALQSKINPHLASRYPGSTRMSQLVDGARNRRGY
jgi:hypothetical protein